MEEWIALREFARRRGVELSAVQKAIASGRVTAVRRSTSGRLAAIEVHQATAQWDASTDPAQAARSGKILGAPDTPPAKGESSGEHVGHQTEPVAAPAGTEQGRSPEASSATGSDKDDYYAHRAKREEFQAKQAELDYLEAIGELVPARELREASMRRYRSIRDKVLNIPDRQAAILVGEARSGDPTTAEARVHAALTKELRRVLHELSDDALAEAGDGAGGALAAGGAA